MDAVEGRVAVVTGAASGIGFAIAQALAREGAHVALVDIQAERLESARAEIAKLGVEARAFVLDVSERQEVYAAADKIEQAFGKIHILVNNAGVGYRDVPLHETPDSDLDWLFGVNVLGVLNGIKAFVPRIKKHGEGGHVVNAGSISGLYLRLGWNYGLYSATKAAVVFLSEGLREELATDGIGVSVLCSSGVDTEVFSATRVRPARFGGPAPPPPALADALKGHMPPATVARHVMRAMRDNAFFIITHPQAARDKIIARHQQIMQAYERAEQVAATLAASD